MNGGRPGLRVLLDDAPGFLDGFDDVEAGALGYFDADGEIAVEQRIALAVLEGAAHRCDVADGEDVLAADAHRRRGEILGVAHEARRLDGEPAVGEIDRPGGDQLVVGVDGADDLKLGQPVGFENFRIDDDLEQFLARTGEPRFEDAGNAFEFVFETPRNLQQRAFGRIAVNHGRQNRKLGLGVELADNRFFGVVRQVRLGAVERFAHVEHRLVDVDGRLKFENELRRALIGEGVHLLEALNVLQFKLGRAQQQPFAVFRRNAGQGNGDADKRRRHVGVGFAGDGLVCKEAEKHHDDERRQHDARARKRGVDKTGHGCGPFRSTASTCWPAET